MNEAILFASISKKNINCFPNIIKHLHSVFVAQWQGSIKANENV
jgi:hypothetical protein